MLMANLSVYVASCAQVAYARILKNSCRQISIKLRLIWECIDTPAPRPYPGNTHRDQIRETHVCDRTMSLSGAEWENTAACFHFTLPMTVSHGSIKKFMNNKESTKSLHLPTVHHCDSSSEPLPVVYLKEKYFQW